MKIFQFSIFLLSLCLASVSAQTAKPKDDKSQLPRGSITIRLLADDGQPLDDALVQLYPVSSPFLASEMPARNQNGEFRFDNLKPGVYRVTVSAPGYVQVEDSQNPQANRYRVGDTATLRLTKGAVITGIVTDAAGTPLIEAAVRVIRVRDAALQKLSLQPNFENIGRGRFAALTDDRGVYRVYGLPAGAYVVSGGGQERDFFGSARASGAEGSPTFHPSDPFDTAAEVFVNYGQEAGGIDIRHLGGPGSNLSGTIVGIIKNGDKFDGQIGISLARAETGQLEAQAAVQEENGKFAFNLGQIADGEFVIQAFQAGGLTLTAASEPQKISIKGADVSGLELHLKSLGAISGKIVFEPNPALKGKPECAMKRRFAPEEIELALRRDEKKSKPEPTFPLSIFNSSVTADETGNFEFRSLSAAKYRLTARLADETLFIRAITADPAKGDVGKEALSTGANKLTLTVSNGAPRLSGKVLTEEKEQTKTSEQFLIYLIPAEKEAADNVLRYYEVLTEPSGGFAFVNLAPGKYFLLAQPFRIEKEKPLAFRSPAAWNAEQRLILRREAETQNVEIALAPCQSIINHEIAFPKR